jgi:hypothetical protein
MSKHPHVCGHEDNSVPAKNRVGDGGKDWENKSKGDGEKVDKGDAPIHVADAIAYLLHSRKFVHRDFKPENRVSL